MHRFVQGRKISLLLHIIVYLFLCMGIIFTPQITNMNLRINDAIQRSESLPVGIDILIVEIDRSTVEQVGSYPLPYEFLAQLIRHFDHAGIAKLYLDRRLAARVEPKQDAALADALARLGPSKVAVPGYNPTTRRMATYPNNSFAESVSITGASYFADSDGRFRLLATGNQPNAVHPNPARWLAGQASVQDVLIDQRFDAATIRRVSAWHALNMPGGKLTGKTILMGNAQSLGGSGLTYPGGNVISRLEILALAYETVRSNTEPLRMNKFFLFLFMIGIGVIAILARRFTIHDRTKGASTFLFSVTGVFVLIFAGFLLVKVFRVEAAILTYLIAFALSNLMFITWRVHLLEILRDLHQGNLSVEDSWAWQSVSRLSEPFVLMSFNGPRRLNAAAEQTGFFASDNQKLESNVAHLIGALSEREQKKDIQLENDGGLRIIRCFYPHPDVPLIRLDDITDEAAQLNELKSALHTDALTGCLNRDGFLAMSKIQTDEYSVIMMDMNGFKAVNDTHGHAAGDELLRIAAERFGAVLCSEFSLARLGGDEFCVLLPGISESRDVQRVCDDLEASLCGEIQLGDTSVEVSVAAGFARSRHSETFEAVLDRSDKAMYKRKEHLRAKMPDRRNTCQSVAEDNVILHGAAGF